MAEGTGSIVTKIIMDTTQITQGTQRVNEFKEAVALAKKSKDKSTLFDGEIKSLKELQEQLRQAQIELKRLAKLNKLNDDGNDKFMAAMEKQRLAGLALGDKGSEKYIASQLKQQRLNDDANDKFMAAMEKQRLLGLAKGDKGSEAFIASQLKQQRLNDDANDKFMATREAQYQRQLAMGDKGVEAALANQRKISAANDIANDKFMIAREKQYQAQLAMGDKGVEAFQANQRKMAQAHMDSIVKQNNAEKTSYNQYLNGLARKYEAQGKANDAANDRYMQGLVRRDAREAQLSAQYVNLQAQIRKAAAEAERLWGIQNRTKAGSDIVAYNNARQGLRGLTEQQNAYNASIGKSNTYLDGFNRRVKSHFEWIASGALIAGAFTLPMGIVNTIKEVELGMAGVMQVMPQLHSSRQALYEESQIIIGIAETFGLKVNDIIESYKLWARAYKEVDIVRELVHSAAVLSKADNFSMTEANKAIEGIMLQYGVRIKDAEEAAKVSMRIVDSITNVSHNAMISAQDLAAANIRSASAAKQAGVSFDYLQGMIATMSRNTGRAGGEIGNAIRSMMVSFHSDKAVAEIEKMGVAMYKVGKDGTKSFRDAEEVITELMLVTDATDKNVEKMLLSISGGKFQYNKVSALIGDFNELIRVTDLSINSKGVGESQTAMQLETISTKLAAVKAQMESIAVGTGNAGLTVVIKEIIAATGTLLSRLQSISAETWQNAASLAIWGTKLYLASKAIIKLYAIGTAIMTYRTAAAHTAALAESRLAAMIALSSVATSTNASATLRLAAANELQAIAATTATVANGRNATMMTMATGGLNILAGTLIAAAVGYTMLNTESAETVKANKDIIDSEAKLAATLKDKASNTEQEIDLMQSKINFMGTLESAMVTLTKQEIESRDNTEKHDKVLEKMETTKKAMINTLGDEAYARVEAAGFTKEAMDIETKAISDAQVIKSNALAEERKAIVAHSMTVADQARQRLEAIKIETQGLADEFSKQSALYAGARGAEYSRLKYEADIAKGYADLGGQNLTDAMGNDDSIFKVGGNDNSGAVNDAKIAQQKLDVFLANDAKATQAELDAAIAAIKNNGGNNYDPRSALSGGTGETGTVTPESTKAGTDKSSGSTPPNDHNKVIARDAYKDAVTLATHRAKLATDEYTASLDNLNTTEEMYGKTADTTVNRLDLMQKRWQALNDQEWESQTNADALNAQLDTMIGDTGALGVSKDDWKAMTPLKRAELKVQYRDVLDAHKDLKAVTAAYYAWEEKASKEHLDKTKLGNDIAKASRGYKPEELEQRSLSRNKTTEEILIAQNTNKFDGNNDRTLNAIHLKARLEDEKVYAAALLRLEAELNANKETLRTQANDGNRVALQKMVDDSQDAYDKQRAIVAKNAQDIKDLEYSKNAKIKEGLADIVDNVIVKGGSLKEIWGNLWNALASSAIKALFQINNASGDLLGSIFGLFGGGGAKAPSPTAGFTGSTPGVSSSILGVIPSFFADGGIVNKPTNAIIGETGEQETVINLGKLARGDQRQQSLLSYANSKLGMGTKVAPNISQKTIDTAQNASLSNKEVVERLDRTNALLESLANITLNKEVGGGQSGIAQPIVFPVSQGDDALFAQIQGMRRKGMKV